MRKIILSIVFFVFFGGLTACSTTKKDPIAYYPGESANTIYQRGNEALLNRNYGEAVKRFEALQVQYPDQAVTEDASLKLIYAYYGKEEYALASASADHFIRLYPANRHIDYAYYMRGMAEYYQNLGIFERIFAIDLARRDTVQVKKAYQDFATVYRNFPSSYYAPAAHQYAVYLRNVLADHEWHIAYHYYKRKAYVASANRATILVTEYQGAPQTKKGLILLAKSYHQLRLTKLEQDVMKVIHYNYPDFSIKSENDF